MLPLTITRSVQHLQRLQHIARVLTQQGFGHIVDQLDLGRFVPIWLRRKPRAGEDGAPAVGVGRRLRRVANELGPLFVKLGQMMATRPDILPRDILDELRRLEDSADSFDPSIASQIIVDDLRIPLPEAYATFDEKPIACGSIGQVHRATLRDGRSVVIKVRRPHIEKELRSDLQLLTWLAEALDRWVPEAAAYHPTTIVEEFERTLLRELDYLHEAATTSRLREAFSDDDQIRIPEVIWSHTTANVLTLEAIPGENLRAALASDGHRLNRKELAARLADMYLRQFFEVGTFHADPHPGNILVQAPARVGLIDFGQVGTISDAMAGHLLILLFGMVNRDMDIIADALSEMGAFGAKTDRAQLMRDLHSLVDKYYGQPVGRLNMSTIFGEGAETIRRHDVAVPRDVILMLKSLTTVWGVALQLDPELDAVAMVKPRLAALVRSRFEPRRVLRMGGLTLWHVVSFLRSGPQQLRNVLQQVASGQWQLNVRHDNLEPLGRDLDRSSNRLAFSIVIAGLVVGSSVVVSADPQVELVGIRLQTFGIVGYLLAGVLGLGLLWAIFRSGRLS